MAHTAIDNGTNYYSFCYGYGIPPANDWTTLSPSIPFINSNFYDRFSLFRADKDLESFVGKHHQIKKVKNLINHAGSKPSYIGVALRVGKNTLIRIFSQSNILNAIKAAGTISTLSKIVAVFKSSLDLTELYVNNMEGENRIWKQLSIKASKFISISKDSVDVVGYFLRHSANVIGKIATGITIVSAPFIGIDTYRSLNECLDMYELSQSISSLTKGNFTEVELKQLGSLFIRRQSFNKFTAWQYHSDNFDRVQERFSQKDFEELVKSIIALENGEHIPTEKLSEYKELAKESAYWMKFHTNLKGFTSLAASLGASYSIGSAIIPKIGLSFAATAGLNLIAGAAFIGGTAYLGYQAYSYLSYGKMSLEDTSNQYEPLDFLRGNNIKYL